MYDPRSCGLGWAIGLVLACVVSVGEPAAADEPLTLDEARGALRRAVGFFHESVSASGGYLWRYSSDLTKREGENLAGPRTAWVQPPGTPAVGGALLTAYRRTGDDQLLEAARASADALVRGQLHSGGWDYRIEFDPQARRRYAYRVDGPAAGKRSTTTLDDNTTQAALKFLMRVDQELRFQDKAIHEAARYALDHLLDAQYPNGAWPQRFSEPPRAKKFPVLRAGYPDAWVRKYPKRDYRTYYTFNDNTIADMISTMFEAAAIYGETKYGEAAQRGGDFILLAQMPDPQPAWAQQYNADMRPAWARKFEPPAVTGGESQQVLRTLLGLYRQTGKAKYLAAIPKAVEYLEKSRLPDGRLARFYELKTNRPLFFTKDYQLTYSSQDMPTHYAFIVGSRLKSIRNEYERLRDQPWKALATGKPQTTFRMTASLAARAKGAVDQMDARGAWVERGSLRQFTGDEGVSRIIDTRTFATNVDVLSRFIAAARRQ